VFDRDFTKAALANMAGTLMAALVVFVVVWLSGIVTVQRAQALKGIALFPAVMAATLAGAFVPYWIAKRRLRKRFARVEARLAARTRAREERAMENMRLVESVRNRARPDDTVS
jgi:membrane protein DedA with SNARE-associated domain